MRTVSRGDFRHHVDELSDIARSEPVLVTEDGQPSLVLLSAEDYERLRLVEQRTTRAVRTADLPLATIEAIRRADLSHLPTD